MSLKTTLRKSCILPILGYMSSNGNYRFSNLKRDLGVSSSTLIRRLADLQREGLVEVIPDVDRRVFEYRLTKRGRVLSREMNLDQMTKVLSKAG
jgi:DNA-binding HxlR family transcriptional regulator